MTDKTGEEEKPKTGQKARKIRAKTKSKKQKTGRKLTPIDLGGVEKLAAYGCTNVEIGDYFGVNETTIRNRFSEILTKTRADQKMRLRKMQWNTADTGNPTMQIWLGKQMLGQKEKTELTGDPQNPAVFYIPENGRKTRV